MLPTLFIVVPCYNEEAVLPITAPLFLNKIISLIERDKIDENSRVLFIDDGSKDETWSIINQLSRMDRHYIGIRQSRNRGHQNAVLAGLMEAKELCDITISIDCDGQDDINAMDQMVEKYLSGYDVVYGVRSNRETDTHFKRNTAQGFYKVLALMGAEVVYNHADYRLVSSRVLKEFAKFEEVNLFLRGLIPLVGFQSTTVEYVRAERIAGESHYPLKKMIALAINGITSLSVTPLRLIFILGVIISSISFVCSVVELVFLFCGRGAAWLLAVFVVSLLLGIQIACTGIVGEYIGKTYMEVKHRPRYIISERTWSDDVGLSNRENVERVK